MIKKCLKKIEAFFYGMVYKINKIHFILVKISVKN